MTMAASRSEPDSPNIAPSLNQYNVIFVTLLPTLHQACLYAVMATPREPNPLRPYYIPPSVGLWPEANPNGSAATNISGKHASTSTNSFGSSARNILADMDYSEYLSDSSPSPSEVIKGLVEQVVWKYTSVFLAQPFEVAKTILQVQVASRGQKVIGKDAHAEDMRRKPGNYRRDSYQVSLKAPSWDFIPNIFCLEFIW